MKVVTQARWLQSSNSHSNSHEEVDITAVLRHAVSQCTLMYRQINEDSYELWKRNFSDSVISNVFKLRWRLSHTFAPLLADLNRQSASRLSCSSVKQLSVGGETNVLFPAGICRFLFSITTKHNLQLSQHPTKWVHPGCRVADAWNESLPLVPILRIREVSFVFFYTNSMLDV